MTYRGKHKGIDITDPTWNSLLMLIWRLNIGLWIMKPFSNIHSCSSPVWILYCTDSLLLHWGMGLESTATIVLYVFYSTCVSLILACMSLLKNWDLCYESIYGCSLYLSNQYNYCCNAVCTVHWLEKTRTVQRTIHVLLLKLLHRRAGATAHVLLNSKQL